MDLSLRHIGLPQVATSPRDNGLIMLKTQTSNAALEALATHEDIFVSHALDVAQLLVEMAAKVEDLPSGALPKKTAFARTSATDLPYLERSMALQDIYRDGDDPLKRQQFGRMLQLYIEDLYEALGKWMACYLTADLLSYEVELANKRQEIEPTRVTLGEVCKYLGSQDLVDRMRAPHMVERLASCKGASRASAFVDDVMIGRAHTLLSERLAKADLLAIMREGKQSLTALLREIAQTLVRQLQQATEDTQWNVADQENEGFTISDAAMEVLASAAEHFQLPRGVQKWVADLLSNNPDGTCITPLPSVETISVSLPTRNGRCAEQRLNVFETLHAKLLMVFSALSLRYKASHQLGPEDSHPRNYKRKAVARNTRFFLNQFQEVLGNPDTTPVALHTGLHALHAHSDRQTMTNVLWGAHQVNAGLQQLIGIEPNDETATWDEKIRAFIGQLDRGLEHREGNMPALPE